MKPHSTTRPGAGASAAPLGVVLSGGASRRMQTDKARLEIERKGRRHTLLSWTLHRLFETTPEVVLMDGGRGHSGDPALADFGPITALPDGSGAGPAAGLLGAWAHAPERALLVLASDLPEVPPELLKLLVLTYRKTSADWILTRTGQRLHPLCAVYGPRVRAELERAVAAGRSGLWSLYDRTRLHRVVLESPALSRFGEPAELLCNVNTLEDYNGLPGTAGGTK